MSENVVVPDDFPAEGRRHTEQGTTARWWVWGALIGLVVGWIIGLVVVRPGADDLLKAAVDLVPETAEVTDAFVSGEDFQLIAFNPPPAGKVDVVSDLTPEALAEDFEATAASQGWTILGRVHRPNGIIVELRSALLTGRASILLNVPRANVRVARHSWTGRVVTGTSSIIGAVMGGLVAWYLYRRVRGGKPPRHAPIRWWHLAGLIVLAALWLRGLSVIG